MLTIDDWELNIILSLIFSFFLLFFICLHLYDSNKLHISVDRPMILVDMHLSLARLNVNTLGLSGFNVKQYFLFVCPVSHFVQTRCFESHVNPFMEFN